MCGTGCHGQLRCGIFALRTDQPTIISRSRSISCAENESNNMRYLRRCLTSDVAIHHPHLTLLEARGTVVDI